MDGPTVRRVLELEEVLRVVARLPVESQARLARIHRARHPRCTFRRAGGGQSAKMLGNHLRGAHRWRFRIARKTSVCRLCGHLVEPEDTMVLLAPGRPGTPGRHFAGWIHVEPCLGCRREGRCQ